MMPTDAQCTISRQQLRERWCPICERPKSRGQCFCKKCYFALPCQLQAPLYVPRFSEDEVIRWTEGYQRAKTYLRELFGERVA